MNSLTLFKSRETPVDWRSVVPGLVLTAGIANPVAMYLKDTPEMGDGLAIAPGRLKSTLRRMGDLATVVVDFADIEITGTMDHVVVDFRLPGNTRRGYYRLHTIKYNANGEAEAVYDAWVIVDKTIEPTRDKHMEINSVRTQFADLRGEDNKMLDSLEIGAGDIAEAVERCLEQWTATAPRTSTYYGDTFPYPELLRNGVLSMLLKSLCTILDRNRMTYQAEGVSVDLERRVDIYRNLQAEYDARWRAGMMQMKNEENVNCFMDNLVYL